MPSWSGFWPRKAWPGSTYTIQLPKNFIYNHMIDICGPRSKHPAGSQTHNKIPGKFPAGQMIIMNVPLFCALSCLEA